MDPNVIWHLLGLSGENGLSRNALQSVLAEIGKKILFYRIRIFWESLPQIRRLRRIRLIWLLIG
jgi:hypothetical protein